MIAEVLRLYKKYGSPLLPRSCRYSPTCSEYVRVAVVEQGVLRGLSLGIWRLIRCNPLHPGGIDLP